MDELGRWIDRLIGAGATIVVCIIILYLDTYRFWDKLWYWLGLWKWIH